MTGWMPGGSAGTSFCSGTEMSISFRAMAASPLLSILHLWRLTSLQVKHGDGPDRRSGSFAPFHRQADEGELPVAEQRFQVAQAFDVGDIEVKTCLVNQQVDFTIRTRAHRIDAEMHDALTGQPFGGLDIDAGIVGCIFLAREGALVMAGTEQHGTAFGHGHAGLPYRDLEIGGADLGARCDMPQIDADARHDALFQRVSIDRNAAWTEMPGCIDMGAGVIDH